MKSVRSGLLALTVLLACSAVTPAAAQEPDVEAKERRNAIELFLGGVTEADTGDSGNGIGLEYNRRLSPRWSIGVEALELSTTDVERTWLVLVPMYFHPVEALNLKAGLGAEGSKDKPENGEDSETETQLAVRIGAGWEFPLGSRFEITPEINLDFVGGKTTWVYGISVGLKF